MEHFADIERVAQCVPGASLDGQDDEGYWLGTVVVSFGPKKIHFKGRVKCEFDPTTRTGLLIGGGAGAGGSANVKMQTRFSVTGEPEGDPQPQASRVEVVSEANVTGILAGFAATGGKALGRQLLREFAANFEAAFSGSEASRPTDKKDLSALKLIVRTALKR
jgi:carbon monoxide dehydrogenase subunit G